MRLSQNSGQLEDEGDGWEGAHQEYCVWSDTFISPSQCLPNIIVIIMMVEQIKIFCSKVCSDIKKLMMMRIFHGATQHNESKLKHTQKKCVLCVKKGEWKRTINQSRWRALSLKNDCANGEKIFFFSSFCVDEHWYNGDSIWNCRFNKKKTWNFFCHSFIDFFSSPSLTHSLSHADIEMIQKLFRHIRRFRSIFECNAGELY